MIAAKRTPDLSYVIVASSALRPSAPSPRRGAGSARALDARDPGAGAGIAVKERGELFGHLAGQLLDIGDGYGAVAGAYLTAQAMVIPGEIVALDIWVLCATTVVLIAFACTGWTFSRRAGSLCVLAYAVYLAVQISTKSPSPVT